MLQLNLKSTVKCHWCLMGKWFYFRNIRRAYSEIWSLNIKGKERKNRIRIFFLQEGAARLGLFVEGEDGRLGVALVMSVYDYTSPSAAEFWARQARTRRYWVCVSQKRFIFRLLTRHGCLPVWLVAAWYSSGSGHGPTLNWRREAGVLKKLSLAKPAKV
jgi:hypothetical protein